MEKRFDTGDGQAVLAFLKEQLVAEVPYVGNDFAYFRLKLSLPDGDVIGFTEVAHRRYQRFFNQTELCLLHELPLREGELVYCFYGSKFWQNELSRKFGGFCVGNYWLLNNETRSYYGYTSEVLPTAQDIIDFVEALKKVEKSSC